MTGQGVALTFVMIPSYIFIYFLVGRMGRLEFIERGWYKRDASIFVEILMSPIFIISGVLLALGLLSVAMVYIIPALIIMYFVWAFFLSAFLAG